MACCSKEGSRSHVQTFFARADGGNVTDHTCITEVTVKTGMKVLAAAAAAIAALHNGAATGTAATAACVGFLALSTSHNGIC